MKALKTGGYRVVYRIAASRTAVACLSACHRLAGRWHTEEKARRLLHRLACLLTLDVINRPGWVNLHRSRLYWKSLHASSCPARTRQTPPRWQEGTPLKVGIFGMISGTILTQEPLFRRIPPEIELHVFDVPCLGHDAGYLAGRAASYTRFSVADGEEWGIAQAINTAGLDVVINIDYLLRSFRILDLLEVPCIIHLCSGSDLLHHDKVDIQWFAQPEAEYFPRGNRMFCARSRQYFSRDWIHQAPVVYDLKDLDGTVVPAWKERRNWIFWHGSLYKLASSRRLLAVLLALLADDRDLEFSFMGRDDQGVWGLKDILAAARRLGVQNRVHYTGRALVGRGAGGSLQTDHWGEVRSLLWNSRLWPDTWPAPGGSARVEAYASGLPSVHMGVRFEPAAWGRSQWNVIELPDLLIPEATAWTPREYQDLCRRCLYDETFADALAARQRQVALQAGDGRRFWNSLLVAYRQWLADKKPSLEVEK